MRFWINNTYPCQRRGHEFVIDSTAHLRFAMSVASCAMTKGVQRPAIDLHLWPPPNTATWGPALPPTRLNSRSLVQPQKHSSTRSDPPLLSTPNEAASSLPRLPSPVHYMFSSNSFQDNSSYTNGLSPIARRDSTGQNTSPYQAQQQQLQQQQLLQQQQQQAGMVNMFPTAAGHQLDLNHLWQQVQELSAILAANRESTVGLVRRADEIRVCGFFFVILWILPYHIGRNIGRSYVRGASEHICTARSKIKHG